MSKNAGDAQWTAWIAGALMVAGVVVPRWFLPTDVSAPKSSEVTAGRNRLTELERVDARLWEDPFEALRRTRVAEKEARDLGFDSASRTPDSDSRAASDGSRAPVASSPSTVGLSDLKREICRRRGGKFDGKAERNPGKGEKNCSGARAAPGVRVLAVTVPGLSRRSNAEDRRRVRVALHSAVTVAGWHSVTEEKIGVLRWSRPKASPPDSMLIPFEWLEVDSERQTLVIWFDEDAITTVLDIRELLDALIVSSGSGAEKLCDPQASCTGRVPVVVVGPTGSGVLQKWVRADAPKAPKSDAQYWAALFSPVSSVPPAELLPESSGVDVPDPCRTSTGAVSTSDADDTARAESRLICRVGLAGVRFVRAAPLEAVPLRALAREIDQRHDAVRPPECKVVLVTEADSLYTRSLRTVFEHEFAEARERRGEGGSCTILAPKEGPSRASYAYLRNINEVDGNSTDARGMPRETAQSEARPNQRTVGSHQFDYVHRLVHQIERDVDAGTWDRERVFAIGILGSDPFDKLSIMKALKPAFPAARFFTTDYDSALADPRVRNDARNLIVASSYPTAMPEFSSLPEFRSATQASYAAAFRAALTDTQVTLPERAQVIEMGLEGPVVLGRPPAVCKHGTGLAARIATAGSLYTAGVMASLALLLGALLLGIRRVSRVIGSFVVDAPVSSFRDADGRIVAHGIENDRRIDRLGYGSRVAFVCGIGVLCCAYCVLGLGALLESCRGDGEPFAVLEGVSLWTPVLLRVVGSIGGLYAVLYFMGGARAAFSRMGRDVGFSCEPEVDRESTTQAKGPISGVAPSASSPKPWGGVSVRRATFTQWLPFMGAERSTSRKAPPGPDSELAYESEFDILVEFGRSRTFLVLGAVVVASVLALVYYGAMLGFDDPNVPSRGTDMSALNRLAVFSAAFVVTVLASIAFLHLGLLMRAFLRLVPEPDTMHSRPSTQALRAGVAQEELRAIAWLKSQYEIATDSAERDTKGALAFAELAGTSTGVEGSPEGVVKRFAVLDRRVALIEGLSRGVRWFSYVPFAVGALMLIARFRWFENQTFPPILGAFYLVVTSVCVWNAWRLYRAAQKARSRSVARLEVLLAGVIARLGDQVLGTRQRAVLERFFRARVQRIAELDSGVFAPLARQPFFVAFAFPITSIVTMDVLTRVVGLG